MTEPTSPNLRLLPVSDDPLTQAQLAAVIAVRDRNVRPALGLPEAQEPKYTTDGNHIINRATREPIPHHEPIFIMRARDRNALFGLIEYSRRCKDTAHVEAIHGRISDFARWAALDPSRIKEPDTAPMSDRALRSLARDVLAEPAPAVAPAAEPAPAPLAFMDLLNRLIDLGAKASHALAESNADDGPRGTEAAGRFRSLRNDMARLIVAPATGAQA